MNIYELLSTDAGMAFAVFCVGLFLVAFEWLGSIVCKFFGKD